MKKMLEKTLDFEMAMPLPESQENLKGDSLESLLVEEEKVLWKGMPSTDLLERPTITAFTFSQALNSYLVLMFVVLFIFFWGEILPVNFIFYVYVAFVGSVFLLLLFVFLFAITYVPQWLHKNAIDNSIKKNGRIRYFYTTEKIIFKTEENYQFIPFDYIKNITFTATKEGQGTIHFIIKEEFRTKVLRTYDIYNGTTRHSPTFELILDVAKFHKKLVKVFKSANK